MLNAFDVDGFLGRCWADVLAFSASDACFFDDFGAGRCHVDCAVRALSCACSALYQVGLCQAVSVYGDGFSDGCCVFLVEGEKREGAGGTDIGAESALVEAITLGEIEVRLV